MIKKNITAVLAVMLLITSLLCGCSSGGKHGEFYPYRLSSYVSLGSYKNISYEPMKVSVSSEDVDNEIYAQMKKYGLTTLEEKSDAIKNGDTAIINYTGYIDGKTFEGGSASNKSLEIGSGSFIDGFESGLVGKKAGDKVTLNLKFPDGYHAPDYAGKKVKFDVEISKVYQTIYPEITHSVISKFSNVMTVKEYREQTYDRLVEEKTEQAEATNRSNLISAVIDCCKIKKYPQAEVDSYKQDLVKKYEHSASNDGITLETLVSYNGLTMQQFEAKMEQDAKNLVAKDMVFLMIAEKEGLEITDEEYEQGIITQMEANNITSKKTFLELVGEDNFRGLLLIEKAIDNLEAHLTKGEK